MCRALLLVLIILHCSSAHAHTRQSRFTGGTGSAFAAASLLTAITGRLSSVPPGRPTPSSSSLQPLVLGVMPRGIIGLLFGAGETAKFITWMMLTPLR